MINDSLSDIVAFKKGGPSVFQRAMILLKDYDGLSNIATVPLDFIWIWVEMTGMPPGLLTAVHLIGKTIGSV
ncbi:hypothetical protein ACLB2K_045487 [Fragaria x ananassa]